jgi:hypothetical protein
MAKNFLSGRTTDPLDALDARARSLLASKRKAEAAPALHDAGQGQQDAPVTAKQQDTEATWQECLDLFLKSSTPSCIAAQHFLKVIDADGDANKVLYPHVMFRSGYPKPMCSREQSNAEDGNDREYVLPGLAKTKLPSQQTEGCEKQIEQQWFEALAKSLTELRCSVHEDCSTFDMELVPWPLFPLHALAGSVSNEPDVTSDISFFEECRHLRANVHAELKQFYFSCDSWPSVPENVIADDICTDVQLKLLETRAKRGPLSQAALQRRTVNVDPRFFKEVFPVLEKKDALLEMHSRWEKDLAAAAHEHDKAAEYGAQFVSWPVQGKRCWPQPSRAWVQHARWFEMWRSSQRLQQTKARKEETVSKRRRPQPITCTESEASWEALSECSDSSWQALSEFSDGSWMDLATESDILVQMESNVNMIAMMQRECQKDLDAAMPALNAAVSALQCLSKSDVVEMKSFQKPPQGCVLVAKALCVCLDCKPKKACDADYWAHGKKLLGDATLLKRLVSYDKDDISADVMDELTQLDSDPNFQPDQMAKVSKAAQGICQWVRTLSSYAKAAKCIAPKQEALRKLEAELDLARSELAKRREPSNEDVMAQPEEDVDKETHRSELQARAAKQAMETAHQENFKAATGRLTKGALQELKSLGKPPQGVADVLIAVNCLLTSRQNRMDWKDCQKMLSNPSRLLADLQAFDAEHVSDSTLKHCDELAMQAGFNYDAVKVKSLACADLCDWFVNVMAYSKLCKADGQETFGCAGSEMAPNTSEMEQSDTQPSHSKAHQHKGLTTCIRKGDLTELKSLANPPQLVIDTLCAVNVILSDHEPCWTSARAMISDPRFISKVLSFNASCIKPTTVERLEPLMRNSRLDPSEVKRRSAAAEGLCKWVCNVYQLGLQAGADAASTASPTSNHSQDSPCSVDSRDLLIVSSPDGNSSDM